MLIKLITRMFFFIVYAYNYSMNVSFHWFNDSDNIFIAKLILNQNLIIS